MSRCQFDGCTVELWNHPFLNSDKSGCCSQHICLLDSCTSPVLSSIRQAEACKKHTCTFPGCVSAVCTPEHMACTRHTCGVSGCFSTILEGQEFCTKHTCCFAGCHNPNDQHIVVITITVPNMPCTLHKCIFPGCHLCILNDFDFCCPNHQCLFCKLPRQPNKKGCQRHACRIAGCNEASSKGLCADHQCCIFYCGKAIVSTQHKLCRQHLCGTFDCHEPALPDHHRCVAHTCKFYDLCQANGKPQKQCLREGYQYSPNLPPLCLRHVCANSSCTKLRSRHGSLCAKCQINSPEPKVAKIKTRKQHHNQSQVNRVARSPYQLRSRQKQ